MKRLSQFTMLSVCAVLGAACLDSGEAVYGESFTDAQFRVFDPSVGVHPSQAVLEDPANPFALVSSGRDTRFEIEASDVYHVTAFYSWASWLAREPTGEAQFFAAANLQEIWESGHAPQQDLPVVREMAIAGYQSVLDNFPNAGVFDESGTSRFELLTPAYLGIVELGGEVEGGWIVVIDEAGIPRAVKR